jgi:outer membrane protein assembly factor BamB
MRILFLLAAAPLLAQRGVNDWMTDGFDGQRSSWVRNDVKINPASMQKPGFALVWKLPTANRPRGQSALTPPSLLDFYIGYRGFRSLGFLTGSEGQVIAIDTDLGRVEWEKKLSGGALPEPTSGCPGGLTVSATRPLSSVLYPAPPTGGGFGRGSPAKSAVGEPREGAVTLRSATPPAAPAAPAKPATAAPVAPAPSPFVPRVQWASTIAPDGKLHLFWVSNGNEPNPAIPFLPPNANARGLVIFDEHAYVVTSNGCGGVDDGLWMLDIATKKVDHWKSNSPHVAGPAIGPDGTLYVASGGELVALEPKTLRVKARGGVAGARLTSTPAVFSWRDRDLVAVSTEGGGISLFDARRLESHSRPGLNATAAPAALATWVDPAGERWILAPVEGAFPVSGFRSTNGPVADGAIVAWKVVEKSGAPAVEPGWVSTNMVSPKAPLIINGVVFAAAGGRAGGPNAVLYALDAITGKEVWSSGGAIHSFVTTGGLSAGGSRVYVSTHDGVQYAFGFPIETLD